MASFMFECKNCGRLFRESYEVKGYHSQVKKICLEMYLNGMGFRAIERVTEIHHTTIMNWVKESAQRLPEDEEDHPTVAELDELQTFIGRKTDKIWLRRAINHHAPGILAIEIGDCLRQCACAIAVVKLLPSFGRELKLGKVENT